MAELEPEPRRNKDGSLTYRVRWRENGDRPTYTFNTNKLGRTDALSLAERFRMVVTLNGDRLPTREQLQPYGLDWILGPAQADDDRAPLVESSMLAMSVTKMVTAYIDQLEASVNAPEKRTTKEYRSYLRLYVECRPFGELDAATCEYSDVDDWQTHMLTTLGPYSRKILSRNSVEKIRSSLLAPAFTWACSKRSGPIRILPSPFIDAEKVETEDPEEKAILESPEEMAIFLRAAYLADPNFAAYAAVAAATGQRWGEIAALPPRAIVRHRNLLRILQRSSQGEVLDRTKNGTYREVPVPVWMMTRLIVPRSGLSRPTVFCGPTGNAWSYSTEWDRWDATRKNMAAAGRPLHITHHCLRHSLATWLKSHEIHPEKIDMVVGHRDGKIGRRYDRLTVRDRDHIREVVTALIPESSWPSDA